MNMRNRARDQEAFEFISVDEILGGPSPARSAKAMPSKSAPRRRHNLALALKLAKAGIAVFPVANKRPRIMGFQFRDDGIPQADWVNEKRAEAKAQGLHYGSTINPKRIKALWRDHPDATPAIALGPSKLYCIDCDHKTAKDGSPIDGVRLFQRYAKENRIDLSGSIASGSQSSGMHYIFADRKSLMGAKPAEIHPARPVDWKGAGGYIVAPGSWRADGKRYADTPEDLIEAFETGLLAELPEALAAFPAGKYDPTNEHATGDGSTKVNEHSAEARASRRQIENDLLKLDGLDLELAFDRKALGIDDLLRDNDQFALAWNGDHDDGSKIYNDIVWCLVERHGTKLTPAQALAAVLASPPCEEGRINFVGRSYSGDKEPGDFRAYDIAKPYCEAVAKLGGPLESRWLCF